MKTNEEKAREIQVNDVCCVWNGGCPNVRSGALEMAKWKDEQFESEKQQWIDKACEWLTDNKEHPLIGCEDAGLSGFLTEEFITEFRKAMEGGEK